MKTKITVVGWLVLIATVASAKEARFYEKGALLQMEAVSCGFEEKDGKGIVGSLIGTDSEHKKTHETLCQEYVLRSDRMVYRIRSKEERHPILLPVGDSVQFRIRKDRMLLLAPELDNKEREYFVTSMRPREQTVTADVKPQAESTK